MDPVSVNECAEKLSQVLISIPPGPAATSNAENELIEIERELTKYLEPLYEQYHLKDNVKEDKSTDFHVSAKLMGNLFHFIWGPDVFRAPPGGLRRMYTELSVLDNVTRKQSDVDDLMCYHPTELIAQRFIKLIVAIALADSEIVSSDFAQLLQLLINYEPQLDADSQQAFKFLLDNVECLYHALTNKTLRKTGGEGETAPTVPDYESLGDISKIVITGLSALFMKQFRVRPKERFERMKYTQLRISASIEWPLYVSELLRMKRREPGERSKRPSPEEFSMLELTLSMEPRNPFVRLNLIDSVIDAVRECNGRFQCGEHVHLTDMDTAMRFLQQECRLLCQEFPNNVSITSTISDYFARYVPFVYFDKEFSGTLLNAAYELNPNNWKTTHRLGIFHRMNMKNVAESAKWLEETLELYEFHYNGNLDYIKTQLAKSDRKSHLHTAKHMEERLAKAKFSGWKSMEMAEFQFYIGLSYFAAGQVHKALDQWEEVLKVNELLFALTDVDADCSIYGWKDEHLSCEKIREWMLEAYETGVGVSREGETNLASETRARNVERMFHLMLGLINPLKPDQYFGPYAALYNDASIRRVVSRIVSSP